MTRYIDADALLQKVGFLEGRVVGVYKNDILATPTADVVEVVHARWEFIGDYDSKCSHCGEESSMDHENEPPICQWCGARMDADRATVQEGAEK